MPGQRCIVCGNNEVKDPDILPRDPVLWSRWLWVFQLQESDLKPSTRVCFRHSPEGNVKKEPSVSVGKYLVIPSLQDSV